MFWVNAGQEIGTVKPEDSPLGSWVVGCSSVVTGDNRGETRVARGGPGNSQASSSRRVNSCDHRHNASQSHTIPLIVSRHIVVEAIIVAMCQTSTVRSRNALSLQKWAGAENSPAPLPSASPDSPYCSEITIVSIISPGVVAVAGSRRLTR